MPNCNMRKMYTEQQIVDLVKANISGGTKLYQHIVKANGTQVLLIIATKPTLINSTGTISWPVFVNIGAVSVYVQTNNILAPLSKISATSEITLSTVANTTTATIQYSDTITDTVTEL